MISYSDFKHSFKDINGNDLTVPASSDFRVFINGAEIPVYKCRISAYPLNRLWPGFQRPIDQTEAVSFVNIVSDGEVKLEVEPIAKTEYEKVMLKPYSKGISVERQNGRLVFTLRENGGYVLELDSYHGLLYVFNNKPVSCDTPSSVTHYFGAGIHFPGKISLNSGDSVYVDKDAYVYGSLFAEGAENIRIFGNGIFDDSTEERISEHCYERYTNGNAKFFDCKNIEISGVGFTNSAIWCLNFFNCENVTLDGVRVFGQWRYNTDGVDLVNSSHVRIRNSFIHSFDDTIVIKGIDKYNGVCVSDMLFENCVLWCDWGMTCEVGLETSAPEMSDITFRNCDILRAAACALDVANGDCAYVHDVTFEDIRIELESFYTLNLYQSEDGMKYTNLDKQEIPLIFKVSNNRFRAAYGFIGPDYPRKEGDPLFASANNITARKIAVVCDSKLLSDNEQKDLLRVTFRNVVEGAEFSNITLSDLTFNGEPVSSDGITKTVIGEVKNLSIL